MAQPSAGSALHSGKPPAYAMLRAAVGPEGGFTEEEMALAAAHAWQPTDLGRRILRIETAALVLAAVAPFLAAR